MLVGTDGNPRAADDARPLANIAPAAERPHRFRLDSLDLMRAERAADAAGRKVVGIFHSHPVGRAVPSATDLAEAWPFYSYLILARDAAGGWHARSWRLTGDAFAEETLVLIPPNLIPRNDPCPSSPTAAFTTTSRR